MFLIQITKITITFIFFLILKTVYSLFLIFLNIKTIFMWNAKLITKIPNAQEFASFQCLMQFNFRWKINLLWAALCSFRSEFWRRNFVFNNSLFLTMVHIIIHICIFISWHIRMTNNISNYFQMHLFRI